MFRRLFRGFFTVLGGLIGYEAFELSRYLLTKVSHPDMQEGLSKSEELWIGIFFVFIFGVIFLLVIILYLKNRQYKKSHDIKRRCFYG